MKNYQSESDMWSDEGIKRYVLLKNKDGGYDILLANLISMIAIDVDKDTYNYIIEMMLRNGVEVITDLEKARAERGISLNSFFKNVKGI